jgi:hypothetical protein
MVAILPPTITLAAGTGLVNRFQNVQAALMLSVELRGQQMTAAEHIERKAAVAATVAVEEPTFPALALAQALPRSGFAGPRTGGAKRQTKHPLPHQRGDLLLDNIRGMGIPEAQSEPGRPAGSPDSSLPATAPRHPT